MTASYEHVMKLWVPSIGEQFLAKMDALADFKEGMCSTLQKKHRFLVSEIVGKIIVSGFATDVMIDTRVLMLRINTEKYVILKDDTL